MIRAVTTDRLRVLATDEDEEALRSTAELLSGLGHEVTSLAVDVRQAVERVAADEPDLAVVVLHRDDEHALDLIAELAGYSTGPVVVLLDGDKPEFVRRAAERGVDALARDGSAVSMQSAIEVALRRHADAAGLAERVDQLERALDRRAVIERAKGILMERHRIGDREAFELLRNHARTRGRTVVDTAQAVLDGHALLPGA